MKLSATRCRPLDPVAVSGLSSGYLSVRDAKGVEYVHREATPELSFTVSGALGTQLVFALDAEMRILDVSPLVVEYETEIDDEGGSFHRLLGLLWITMHQWWASNLPKYIRIGDKNYKYYVTWIRDHVHGLKGMKYWDHEVKTAIELFADSQREDGMIWDKCKQMCHSEYQTFRDYEFAEGDFVRPIPGNPTRRWMRIPIENDVEYLFIEGLYYAWKACGDTEWMSRHVDAAARAVQYATSDPYRWSRKFKLLKRGFTIDSWDFQSTDDIARSSTGTVMRVDLDGSEFNVFHGDNTGMARSLEYLATMLDAVGRREEAEEHRRLSTELRSRLDELAFNGEYYRHMVPENPKVERDLGDTPTEQQVSLSNTYALNRGISHEQAVAIIETYRRIRKEMPASSPGEWYNIYPPFEKGFHFPPWEYMNGGVSTIAAGELAHGAFEHGYESYAVDILERVLDLCDEHGGYLFNTFKGKLPDEPPKSNYRPISLAALANVDLWGEGAEGVTGWIGAGENDMSGLPVGDNEFAGVQFSVADPAENGRRAVIGISRSAGYAADARIKIGERCRSVFFLHTAHGKDVQGWDKSTVAYRPHGKTGTAVSPGPLIGRIVLHYSDGSHYTDYVHSHRQLERWMFPAPDAVGGHQIRFGNYRIGYQGANRKYDNVGMFVYGLRNPHPAKPIESIELASAETDAIWLVAGISLSDGPVHFPESKVSYGIPDIWGAAALVYALIEGIAGIVDESVAYDTARVAPRWSAAGIATATAGAVVPASGGYVRYRYSAGADEITLQVAGSGRKFNLEVLLPDDWDGADIEVDGGRSGEMKTVESSRYAAVSLSGPQSQSVRISRK